MTSPPLQHRWSAFSLRSALAVLAAIVWVGPDMWLAFQRQAMLTRLRQAGGRAESYAELGPAELPLPPPPEFSRIRKWLGDEPIALVWLPLDVSIPEADAARLKALFPEASTPHPVDTTPRTPAGNLGPGGAF